MKPLRKKAVDSQDPGRTQYDGIDLTGRRNSHSDAGVSGHPGKVDRMTGSKLCPEVGPSAPDYLPPKSGR